MRSILLPASLLLVPLALTACGEAASSPADEVVFDTLPSGAVHVRSPETGIWSERERWRLVEELRIGTMDGTGPDVFGNIAGLEADGEGRIYVADGQASELRIFGPDGRHLRTLDATLEVPDPMVMRGGAVECRIPASDVVEARGIADLVPSVFGVRVAPDGSLWVNRLPGRAGETRIDVFSTDGEYLGTLPPETPFPAAFTPDGNPVTVERDELDLPYVLVYRVHRA